MAIFTAIATALLSTTFLAGSTFAISALAGVIGIGASYGLNYVAKSLAGSEAKPANADAIHGTEGTLQAGGSVPRAFGVGMHMTAGSLVYANYWGKTSFGSAAGKTPNAYLTQVIALSDLPGERLEEVWVNGEKVTSDTAETDPELGVPVTQYREGSKDHLWIKYYDGTQVAADTLLTGQVSSAARPYPSTRVGTGICYVVCTSLVNDKLFTGFPSFKFVLSGIPLYDPSKDSTNGGSGDHRYSDPATWGGDGDQLPAVQAYNILRGIKYNGAWLYGLQIMAAARLPSDNWITQIAKCRATVEGEAGPEPSYRCGGQINVDTQPASAIEAMLTACQGRLSEIGGFFKIHLGAPDSATFSWTDADLLSTEEQSFRPFFGLSDSVNGIQGTHPDPEQGWETATAPAIYRADLEALDGNRRLMANPDFAFVPYRGQVQRLQQSGLEEAQRARTHVLPFPPTYWVIEPGDVGTWNSVRNGYIDKLFRVDGVVDRANLDVSLSVTEIDPADYDWDQVTDYQGVTTGPTIFTRPAPQGVIDWTAEGTVLYDNLGLPRAAAIRIAWDGTLPGIIGMQYEVRLKADGSDVTRGRSDQYEAGALIIAQGILPLTEYEVRAQYIPSAPRAMLWSEWIDVITPDIVAVDLPAWIANQVTIVFDQIADRVIEAEQRIATLTSKLAAGDFEEIKSVRSQLSSRTGAAFAEISRVENVATDADIAIAGSVQTVSATIGTGFGTTPGVNTVSAKVTTNTNAIATLDNYASANYSVALDVNGYVSGFKLINAGAVGQAYTVFTTDYFLIARPGVAGGGHVPVFAIAPVDGVAKVALRGDMIVDGQIVATKIAADAVTASKIAAGNVTATHIAANSVDAARMVAGTITSDSGVIGALSVKTLSIADAAVTIPVSSAYSLTLGAARTFLTAISVDIDTAGLAGKAISIWMLSTAHTDGFPTGGQFSPFWTVWLKVNGADVDDYSSLNSENIMSYQHVITGTGGVVSTTFQVDAFLTTQTRPAYGTLFALATKR